MQCAACRRLCVRDDFVWKEKQLCAWDYHAQVFGKRGPWHNGPYEERHFETLPACAYVAVGLLGELGVELVLRSRRVARERRARNRQRRARSRTRAAAHGGAHRRRVHGAARGMTNRAIRDLAAVLRAALCRAGDSPDLRAGRSRRPTIAARAEQSAPRAARRRPRPDFGYRRHRARAQQRESPHLSAGRTARASGRLRFAALRHQRHRRRLRSGAQPAGTRRRSRGSSSTRSSPRCAARPRRRKAPTSSRRSCRRYRRSSIELLSRYPRAAGVALDPRTGAVLAMASVPSYDPNALDDEFSALLQRSGQPAARSRPRRSLSAGFDVQNLHRRRGARQSTPSRMDSHFDDPGYLTIGDYTLHDNEGEATGYTDLTTAFALSSNVDFATDRAEDGRRRFLRISAALGHRRLARLSDSRRRRAACRRKAGIVPGELAQMGFGQGALLMTPLQMALIGATIANGGDEPRPYIVRQVVRDGVAGNASRRRQRLQTRYRRRPPRT